jgi:hypothetical protein
MPNKELATVQKLLDSVGSLYDQQLTSRGDQAPNFNLFQILELEGKEVSTHSAFLAHLLDPTETHAQGDLFLRRFLTVIGYKRLASFDEWVVSKEVPLKGGRLNIVLQSANARAIVVIENKIDTQDHENQLQAYSEWLNRPQRRRFFHREQLLFYLTPRGDFARHAPEKIYKRLSYSHHIREWLSSCGRAVKPSKVRESIESYLRTIDNLTTKTLMKDDLDHKILSLIKTPTERLAALRIARVGSLLKDQTLRDFWDRGQAYLEKRLVNANLTYWKLHRTEGSPLDQEYYIELVPKKVNRERPPLSFSFYQFITATLFRWEWLVNFGHNDRAHANIARLPEAKKLVEVMEGRCSMPSRRGSDGYRLITDDKKGIERTLEEELAKSGEVSDFFETGWQIFEQLEPHLRRLNNAVLRMWS